MVYAGDWLKVIAVTCHKTEIFFLTPTSILKIQTMSSIADLRKKLEAERAKRERFQQESEAREREMLRQIEEAEVEERRVTVARLEVEAEERRRSEAAKAAEKRAEKRRRQEEEEEEEGNGSKRLRVGGSDSSETAEGWGSRYRACWNCRSRGLECDRM